MREGEKELERESQEVTEAAWAAHKQTWLDKGAPEEWVATLVDMQRMDAM